MNDLAAQIRAEHAAFMEAGRRTIEHALALGDLLIQAKEKEGHGNWLPWLEKHCPNISERHARNFMAIAKHRAEIEAKSAIIADLTLSQAIDLIPKREEQARRHSSALDRSRSQAKHDGPITLEGRALPAPQEQPAVSMDTADRGRQVGSIGRTTDYSGTDSEASEPKPVQAANEAEATNATYIPTPAQQSVFDVAATSDDVIRDFETLKAAAAIVARAAAIEKDWREDDLSDERIKRELYYLNEIWALFCAALKTAHWKVENKIIEIITHGLKKEWEDEPVDLRKDSLEKIAAELIRMLPDRAEGIARAILNALSKAAFEPLSEAPATEPVQEAVQTAEVPAAPEPPSASPQTAPVTPPAATGPATESKPMTMPDRKRAAVARAHGLGDHDYAEEIENSHYASDIRKAELELDRREAGMAAT